MSTRVPDSWDDEEEASPVRAPLNVQPAEKKKQKIKDDWDDDDDDDEDSQAAADAVPEGSHSTQAVSKSTKALSSVAKAGSSSSLLGSSFPPELAFEPPIRILKRPKQTESQSPAATNNERQTLQEREEKYRLARERIFGSSPGSSSPNERASPPVSRTSTPVAASTASRIERTAGRNTPEYTRIMREPLGPGSQTAFTRKPAPGRSGPASLSQDA